MKNLLKPYNNSGTLRSSGQRLLVTPLLHLSSEQKEIAFEIVAPKLCNSHFGYKICKRAICLNCLGLITIHLSCSIYLYIYCFGGFFYHFYFQHLITLKHLPLYQSFMFIFFHFYHCETLLTFVLEKGYLD